MFKQEPSSGLSDGKLNSLYLKEQEGLKQVLLPEISSEKDLLGEKKPSRFFKPKRKEVNGYESEILSQLNIPSSDSIYYQMGRTHLESPYLWFFFGEYVGKTTELHLGSQMKLQHKILGEASQSLIHFPHCQEYFLLLDKEELKEEVRQRLLSFQNDITPTVMKDSKVSEIYESMTKKLDSIIQPTVSESSDFSAKVEQALLPKDGLSESKRDGASELPLPLNNSLPSMFLHRCFSPVVPSESSQRELQPMPGLVQSLSRIAARFSILRNFTPEEVERMVRENKDGTTEKRDIKGLDPQEKGFYGDLPAINLFYDRFREDFRHTVVTDWEEPEGKLSLSKAEIGDSIEFLHVENAPVFQYEGIPTLTIGEDLQKIEDLIEQYSLIHREQSMKSLEEGASEIPSLSGKTENLLRKLEEAKDDL